MTIRIWSSYSCNNSSAYRLIARFADAARAQAVGAELASLLVGLEDQRNSGFQAMATLYGFAWRDGGMGSDEDGPHVVVDATAVVVQHDNCLGIGPGVPAYLREQGAQVDPETWTDLHVSVLFRPSADPRLEDELAAWCAQPSDAEGVVARIEAPWVQTRTRGRIAWLRDPGVVGMFFPIHPCDLPRLRQWLVERDIERPVIELEAHADRERFVALATARCTACAGTLEYLDPRLHDIETPQLVCRPCGGLYDLAVFT